jgi:hypothetical protein
MKKIISNITFVFQISATFFFLVAIFMMYSILDNEEADFISVWILLFENTLWGIIFSVLTIFVCGIIGLPVRYNINLNNWWMKHAYISLIGFVIGFLILMLAFHDSYTGTIDTVFNRDTLIKHTPNIILIIAGWFICAFSILHCYPFAIIKFVSNLFIKKP